MKQFDYYKGFEGEPEIRFVNQASGDTISMWEGYLDNIFAQIKPAETGWTALAYYYHLCIGWEDESPWRIPDVREALEQFETVDGNTLDSVTCQVLEHLVDLLRTAFEKRENVDIYYE